MLQLNYIRKHKDDLINRLRVRNFEASKIIDELILLDDERKSNQQDLELILSTLNLKSKKIGELFKSGLNDKAVELKKETVDLKENSKNLNKKILDLEKNILDILIQIPNVPNSLVTPGKSSEDNQIIKQVGSIDFSKENRLPHWELCSKYNIIDFDLGNKITGSGFPVYINKGSKFQRSLISYFLDKNIASGYTEYLPPFMVNEDSGFGTGQLPDKEGQMYHIVQDNLYLIPTAEVPITNLFRDKIIKKEQFPIKCTSYTPCFRREAGSYGKEVRGLNRLHQFDKVEIVQIQHPDNSDKTLEEMVNHVSLMLDELALPYRIVRLCGGDMSFTSAITYDFEVYSSGQDRWLEVSSVSNFESYQSNRLKLRYKEDDGKSNLCHTLNGSALAIPRIFASIIENYQCKSGIKVPDVLQKYCGFEMIN
tara:strand:- start:11116 stop:12387 length:1272 start_codon:yes stop_codon:yes gene_type:complete